MLVVLGFLAASSPSFSGGDIYIACPFWDSSFKLLVFLRPQVYYRVDKTTYTWTISLRACGTNGDGSKWRENRVSITIKNTDWQGGMCAGDAMWTSAEYAISKQSGSVKFVGVKRKGKREKEETDSRLRVVLWPSAEIQPPCTMVSPWIS